MKLKLKEQLRQRHITDINDAKQTLKRGEFNNVHSLSDKTTKVPVLMRFSDQIPTYFHCCSFKKWNYIHPNCRFNNGIT